MSSLLNLGKYGVGAFLMTDVKSECVARCLYCVEGGRMWYCITFHSCEHARIIYLMNDPDIRVTTNALSKTRSHLTNSMHISTLVVKSASVCIN